MATNEHIPYTNTRGNIEYPFKLQGIIKYDPPDYTKKHEKQSKWKKIVIAKIDGDICEYYAWFVKKRYNIRLMPPLRDAHLTIINDRLSDTVDYVYSKTLYDGMKVSIDYNPDVRTDGKHWWLRAKCDDGIMLRQRAGVRPEPYFNFHITIGRVDGREHEIAHAQYIYGLISKYGREYV